MGEDIKRIMGKRKPKKQKQQIIKYESNNMSQEQIIEIHAEAYYRALKRIEDEKAKTEEQNTEGRKYRWFEEILFGINVFLWPWKINKKFSINNRIYDSIPVLFVSGILRFAGGCMWLTGLSGFGAAIYSVVICNIIKDIWNLSAISFILVLMGSIFILSGEEFEKETDSNIVYAYSAIVIALVSCIMSIFT